MKKNKFYWNRTNLGRQYYVTPCDELQTISNIMNEIQKHSALSQAVDFFFEDTLPSFLLKENDEKLQYLAQYGIVLLQDRTYLLINAYFAADTPMPDDANDDLRAIQRFFQSKCITLLPDVILFNVEKNDFIVIDAYNGTQMKTVCSKIIKYAGAFEVNRDKIYVYASFFATYEQLIGSDWNMKLFNAEGNIDNIDFYGITINAKALNDGYREELKAYVRDYLYWRNCHTTEESRNLEQQGMRDFEGKRPRPSRIGNMFPMFLISRKTS
jgi:hypothetical protein